MSKSSSLRKMLLPLTTILSLLIVSISAHAQVTFSASCSAKIADFFGANPGLGGTSNCDTFVSSPVSSTVGHSVIETVLPPTDIYSVVARAGYAARGLYGDIGVTASTWAASPSTSPFTLVSDAAAIVAVTAIDTISVTSSVLASGSFVSLSLAGYIEGLVTGHIITNFSGSPDARTASILQSGVAISEFFNGTLGSTASFSSCFGFGFSGCTETNGGFFQSYSESLVVRVGSTLVLTSHMTAQSYSSVLSYGYTPLEGLGEVGAMNSLITNLTPLTDGVQLLAQSGHDYSLAAPVPEPETYAMLLAGLALLGWHARRRKLRMAALA